MSLAPSDPPPRGPARILDGRAIAQAVRAEVAAAVRDLAQPPGLAVVLVGEDPASQIYVKSKARACHEVGIATFDHRLPATTSAAGLRELLEQLSRDPAVHGVLLQLPLPAGLDATAILTALDPRKDVDGLLAENVGRLWLGQPRFVPCTPLGVMRLIKESGVATAGAQAVVVGRSNLVGKPLGGLLLAVDATVTLCHSRTRGLQEHVRAADILVAAVGRPGAIPGAWVKPGAVVIDVGINRLPSGSIVGDVEFEPARERAAAITPVPGGVGPLTIAMLLANTVLSARLLTEGAAAPAQAKAAQL
ncbi:MAG TPA: bifunctional methylenetetrahydrofolate dehydrogenase/methenyltetrahydrofolate cyclohydrolase FolD [Pseudomonadota bacterium]|nr:bifunctional methylenetetrahydrofolate dehydrogenase/methenyltetrahydrofolate cyclohydrolase FolD [Pseudomonadota bacterium]